MFNLIIYITKAVLGGLWLMTILGLLSISPLPIEYQPYILILSGIVLLVHLLEFVAVKATVLSRIKSQVNFMQTMLWGFGYWLPLIKSK